MHLAAHGIKGGSETSEAHCVPVVVGLSKHVRTCVEADMYAPGNLQGHSIALSHRLRVVTGGKAVS